MALHSDRPLRRVLIKLACQIFLGRARAHYHSWLPSLKIAGRDAGNPGVVLFRGKERLRLLGGDILSQRAGERIFIIGSGPSLRDQELSSLPAHSAILLNGAISLTGKRIIEPLAVAIEDERFIWRHWKMIEEHVSAATLCLFSPGVLRAICEIDAGWLVARPVILIDDIRKPYGVPRRDREHLSALGFVMSKEDAGFSADPDRGVFQGGSVAISALQFALKTGAREIGFIGIDISNADVPRFYEADGETAFSGIADAESRILAHIALARDFAASKGIALTNHSPVSALRTIGLDYRPLASTEA